MTWRRVAGLVCLFLVSCLVSAADATLAVVNARVWTGNSLHPWAEALAVSGDRLSAVGKNDEIRSLTTPSTRVIDGQGGILTPGFIDAHMHLFLFDRLRPLPPIFMRFLRGRNAVAERITASAAELPEGTWILGEDWGDATWGGELPSRGWLDHLASKHPVWLTGREGNAGLANSAALRAAGITRDTPDEPPGRIVRDSRGEPTGLILGGPMWRIEKALVERSRQPDDEVLGQVMNKLLRAGVTSVHHNNNWHDFLVLRRLHQSGKLRVRIYASTPLPAWQRLRDYIGAYGRGDEWMHWGGVKGFGAILPNSYYRRVSGASAAGLQVMVHIPGEAGLRGLLAIYDRVRREQRLVDPRFRVEHGHDMPPDLIPVLAKTGVIASWQPPLLVHFDWRAASGVPAPQNLFPCRAMLEAGVRIAFGTDSQAWMTQTVTPVEYLQMALERVAPDGRRISLDEALRASTLDAAYAEFQEQEKGSLEAGKLADFVLFDRDFSKSSVHLIREAKVRLTVVGGRAAYP